MDVSEVKCNNQLNETIFLFRRLKYSKDDVQDGRQLGF